MSQTRSLFKIITAGKSSKRFLLATILGFAFSSSVILSTIGLMDGFKIALVDFLKQSSADLVLTSRKSFFFLENVKKGLQDVEFTPVLRIESFISNGEINKGVLVHGIDQSSFNNVVTLDVSIDQNSVAIGKELARTLKTKVGEPIILTFASNKKRDQGTSIMKKFIVSKLIDHGIYEKNARFVYLDRSLLTKILGYKVDVLNRILIKAASAKSAEELKYKLNKKLKSPFIVAPSFMEYETLISAVDVEKKTIMLILQIIVLISVFNIFAFIIFIMEKKSQEFFLLRSLGVSFKMIRKFWIITLLGVWLSSSILAILFTHLFGRMILKLPFLQLPGDIYVLDNFDLSLDTFDYTLVLGISLLWMIIIIVFSLFRLKNKSLVTSMKEEF